MRHRALIIISGNHRAQSVMTRPVSFHFSCCSLPRVLLASLVPQAHLCSLRYSLTRRNGYYIGAIRLLFLPNAERGEKGATSSPITTKRPRKYGSTVCMPVRLSFSLSLSLARFPPLLFNFLSTEFDCCVLRPVNEPYPPPLIGVMRPFRKGASRC